jgi:hypothetical protein
VVNKADAALFPPVRTSYRPSCIARSTKQFFISGDRGPQRVMDARGSTGALPNREAGSRVVGHVCRYSKDRVPPHTSSKSKQEAGRASTRCHVSSSFKSHLPVEVDSDTTTCPMAPDLAEVSSDGLWITGIKKDLADLDTQLGSCVFKARSYVTKAHADVHAATVHPYSAALAQLTTPKHDYRGDTTRQDGTTVRAMFSAAER